MPMDTDAARGRVRWLLLLCAVTSSGLFLLFSKTADRKAAGRQASQHTIMSRPHRESIQYFHRRARRPLTQQGPHESLPMPGTYRDRG